MTKNSKVLKISDMVEELHPVVREFIINLNYTETQANDFVDGYFEHLNTLPITGKMNALANMHAPCMKAGFARSGISETEAKSRHLEA